MSKTIKQIADELGVEKQKAAADLVMDADVAIEILFAANLFCKAGQHAPSFFWKKLDCLAPFFLTKSFF